MERRKERNLQLLKISSISLILAVICTCSAVSAANLRVDPTAEGGYTTIQAAVDASNAGDTIFVNPGTYVENLKIDKQVSIWSDSNNPEDTVVKAADPAESTVEVLADRVTFSGFGVEDSDNAGILLTAANNCYINNNRVQNAEYGILLRDTESNDINGNIITLNEIGIRLENSNSNKVKDNLIAYNYGPGISLEESSRNIIYNNYFKNAENVEEKAVNANNTWQSTLTTKKNIVRGPYIGGNFWADLEGTGHSETCMDENSNGICDSAYPVTGGGSDNSPLFPKVPSAITTLESKLDAEAYEQDTAAREEAVNETETETETSEGGQIGEEAVNETETSEGGQIEEETEETPETEASEGNGAPGPGPVVVAITVGAAYFLRRKK